MSRFSNRTEHVSREELFKVVTGAASLDPAHMQASSKRLKELMEMQGTAEALFECAADRNLPLNVRQMAILQFKINAIGIWRSRTKYVLYYTTLKNRISIFGRITPDHQVRIKALSFALLDENDPVVSSLMRHKIDNFPTSSLRSRRRML